MSTPPSRHIPLALCLAALLAPGCSMLVDKAMSRAAAKAPHLLHLSMTNGFYMNLHHVVAGDQDRSAEEEALGRDLVNYLLGETYGHSIWPRVKDRALVYGEGRVSFEAYYYEDQGAGGAIIDSFGHLVVALNEGLGTDTLVFSMTAINQRGDLKAGPIPLSFELIPGASNYGEHNILSQLRRDTEFKLETWMKSGLSDAEMERAYGAYVAESRGSMFPTVEIVFNLVALPDGSYTFDPLDHYPVYLLVTTRFISERPELERAVEMIAARGPDRIQHRTGTVAIKLGYVSPKGDSTGMTGRPVPVEIIPVAKRFRPPDFSVPSAEDVMRRR